METELLKIDAFKGIIDSTPQALALNQTSAEKATAAGKILIAKIETEGMSDAMDVECNDFLVKVKKTLLAMNDRRKPVTQIFDEVKKAFTSLEAMLDPKGEVYSKIQQLRDGYAAKKAKEQREREEAAAKKMAIEREKISIRAIIEEGIGKHVYAHIAKMQSILFRLFESATLETFAEVENKVKGFPVNYSGELYDTYQPYITLVHVTIEDKNAILKEIAGDRYAVLFEEVRNLLTAARDSFIDKLPSKRKELEAIASANQAEQERLTAAAAKRKQDEEERQAKEATEMAEKAAANAEVNKQTATATSLFDNQMELATMSEAPAQVREGFEIIVRNPVGYLAIVAFYFEREGKKTEVDKLEKKTLGSMKTFCEALAKSTGEKISNPYLEYKETFKTVAKK